MCRKFADINDIGVIYKVCFANKLKVIPKTPPT
jgi:hypothetical protein